MRNENHRIANRIEREGEISWRQTKANLWALAYFGGLALFGILAAAALTGCSPGGHVDTISVWATKYECSFRADATAISRRVALCDSETECNEICAKLPKP